MFRFTRIPAVAIFLLIPAACDHQKALLYQPDPDIMTVMGRVDQKPDGAFVLISSASSISFEVAGADCVVHLRNASPGGAHSFAVFELDGKYLGRYRVQGDTVTSYPIDLPEDKEYHLLKIFKATEAQNGNLEFAGITCHSVRKPDSLPSKTIEFIGNSITCGYGTDYIQIPCSQGTWYDQHNAYFSYGAILARRLNIGFTLSSVSGIGIYRNWNTDGPALPEVYENTYLNTDKTNTWTFSTPGPDLVSISLGTNDLSDGDGIHYRPPFNKEVFIRKYIGFIETIYNHYPETRIALLSSPVLSGNQRSILEECLWEIRDHFRQAATPKEIHVFLFNTTFTSGCDGHPGKADHEQMADLLVPFFSGLLNK